MGNNEGGEANAELPIGLVTLLAAPARLGTGRCLYHTSSTENCM